MSDDRKARPGMDAPPEPDDIEIVEVVGMDDEGPPRAGDGDEVEVVFDEATAAVSAPTAAPAREDPVARERLLRLQADFENLKRRLEREREHHLRHATASLVARLLPVLDNFERALAHGRQAGTAEAFWNGIALIHRQLHEELRREGLRPVEAVGQPFDPNLHEALATDAGGAHPPNLVVEELQRGYFFQDRLLRPALVRVSLDPASGGSVPPDDREES